jgi:hypothetical protein
MALRIPKNIIIESKYTQGNEYMYKDIQEPYQGYYYELNDKIFAGKEFSVDANELQRITPSNINTFLIKASTYVYGVISNIKLNSETVHSLPITNSDETFYDDGVPLFFCKKINETPPKINRISKETYISLQKNPIYQTTFIGNYAGIILNSDQAYQQMPGLEAFLGT